MCVVLTFVSTHDANVFWMISRVLLYTTCVVLLYKCSRVANAFWMISRVLRYTHIVQFNSINAVLLLKCTGLFPVCCHNAFSSQSAIYNAFAKA